MRLSLRFPRGFAAAAFALALSLRAASAHESRPILLEFDELPDHTWEALFKQPRRGEMAVKLEPRLSNGWLDAAPAVIDADPAFAVRLWRGLGPGDPVGAVLSIEGLRNTLSSALIRVIRDDGSKLQWSYASDRANLRLSAREGRAPGPDRRAPIGWAALWAAGLLACARIGRGKGLPLWRRAAAYGLGIPASAAFFASLPAAFPAALASTVTHALR
jgi:hypothetical protein